MENTEHSRRTVVARGLAFALRGVFTNLGCALRIMGFRASGLERLAVSHEQLLLLMLLYGATVLGASYSQFDTPQFDIFGLGVIGAEFLSVLLVGYLIARVCHAPAKLLQFLVAVYCITPFLYLVNDVLLPVLPGAWWAYTQNGILIWSMAQSLFVTYVMVDRRKRMALAVMGIWLLASLPLVAMPRSFWQEGYLDEPVAAKKIDAERVIYAQYDRLEQALKSVRRGQPGVADLYFVGFGAYGGQDVFMKEVGHIQKTADARLGTRGRSLTLINNSQTVDTIPLASATNLDILLRELGRVMNPEEDVLLLYLTSHGSKEEGLAVDMPPLALNDIRPADLKAVLNRSGIRWRIVLVSACYSGGFIDALSDDHTLVVTAAARDKSSFGCSNQNEYTYFGEAVFKDLKAGPYHFIPRLNAAIAAIGKREQREGLEPSEPQLKAGAAMRQKLVQLERDMAHYPSERFRH